MNSNPEFEELLCDLSSALSGSFLVQMEANQAGKSRLCNNCITNGLDGWFRLHFGLYFNERGCPIAEIRGVSVNISAQFLQEISTVKFLAQDVSVQSRL